MDEATFYRAILAAPDDDGPRLVFADWLEERGELARAEFIRVQCRLARTDWGDPRGKPLRQRQLELMMAHVPDWVAPYGTVLRGTRFRRGFVETAHFDAIDFLRDGAAWLERLPTIRDAHP